MKKIILLALVLCSMMGVDARVINSEKTSRLNAMIADSKVEFSIGDNAVFLPGMETEWRNGIEGCIVVNCYNENDEVDHLGFLLDGSDDPDSSNRYYEIMMFKGKVLTYRPKDAFAYHREAGQWDMIVFRNLKGPVLDVALRCKGDPYEEVKADMQDMINGVWVGASGDTVVLGPIEGYDSNWLPGADYELSYEPRNREQQGSRELVLQYVPERMKRVHMPMPSKQVDENGVTHYYADGKETSRNEYEFLMSMPSGYGGHGSLHGPLLWWVKPQGNDLVVELNEPFVEEIDAFYSNFRDEKFTLKWVRSPYKDNPDRWAVLSMRPVTRGMLSVFDKDALRHMLSYLNSRSNRTDIEELNKNLINTIVNGVQTTKNKTKNKTKRSRKLRKNK